VTDTGLVVLDATSGETIVHRDWGPSGVVWTAAWDSSGQEIYVVAGRTNDEQALRAVSLDGRERIVVSAGGSNLLLHDVSRTGRLLVERATSRRGIMFGTFGSATERDLSWLDGSQIRMLSADGQWVLFGESLQGANARGDVYLRRTDGSPPVRLGDGNPLDLSRDDRWALSLTREKPAKLVLLPTGAGTPRTLDTGGHEPNGGVFSPDGTRVLFGSADSGGIHFFQLDLQSGLVSPLEVAGATPDSAFVLDRSVATAPNGRGVARVLPDGRIEIFDGTLRRIVPGAALPTGDNLAAWALDGQLYAARTSTLPGELYRIDPTTGARQILRTLMPADRAGVTELGPVVVDLNGRSYAYSYRRVTSSDLFVVDR
jgi:eukaryotic-like serine/threonine-protein kinase